MDLSKLPKIGSTPPPTPAQTSTPAPSMAGSADDAATEGQPGRASPVMIGDLGVEVLIASVLGLIFLMLGGSFGGWLIASVQGHAYDTGYTWPDGSAVHFFSLEGGAGWLWMGEWVLGLCLLLEAALCGIGLITRHFNRPMGTACLLLGAIGALANVVAIVMQIQAGFTQPIFSVVALAVGVVTAALHGRRVLA